MNVKKVVLTIAIMLALVSKPVWAETSTVMSMFIADRTEVEAGGVVNLALSGLNQDGEVDLYGEEKGSVIMAVVKSEIGEVSCGGDDHPGVDGIDNEQPATGFFTADVRYVRLVLGNGATCITYDPDVIGDQARTDVVEMFLQERFPTSNGGVRFERIGQVVAKTITVNPADTNPKALRIGAFKPAPIDPRGAADCFTTTDIEGNFGSLNHCDSDIFKSAGGNDSIAGDIRVDDGIMGEMMAGTEGGEILVTAKNPNATGSVTVTLRSKSSTQEYSFTGRMTKGKSIVTIDSTVKKTGSSSKIYGDYYIEATMDGFDSVQLVYEDILRVWSTGDVRGLDMWSDKTVIAKPDFDDATLKAGGVPQLTQGAEIGVHLLDQYGNYTNNCPPTLSGTCTESEVRVKVSDYTGTVSNTAIDLIVPLGTRGYSVANSKDAIIGNSANEVIGLGTGSLVARAVDAVGNPLSQIANSEPVPITVVENSLKVDNVFVTPVLAGTEFNFATVKAIDSRGNIKILADGSSIDLGSAIQIKNMDTGEILTIHRKSDGSDIVKSLLREATGAATRFLVSVQAGVYGEVWVNTPAILPAAAIKVNFEDAHGKIRQCVKPTKTSEDEQANIVILPEVAFKMFDDYGNEACSNAGELRATTPNAASIEYRTLEGNYGVPCRWLTPFSLNRYAHVALSYDSNGSKMFAGQDDIEVNFTKPGLGVNMLTICAGIPVSRELSYIASYIETTDIPVNSVVAMTVETFDQDNLPFRNSNTIMTVLFNGMEGDNLTPTVRLLNGKSVNSGQSFSFENGRMVFVIDVGSQSGQFSITFVDADNTAAAETATFNVTEKINQLPMAKFTAIPSQGEAPLNVTLDASTSTDDGTITQYNWSASDGQTASGENVAITFSNAGNYTINLVVTDDKDAQSTNVAQQTVTVTPKPVSKVPPIANLSVSPKDGPVPLTVNLDGSQSTDADGSITEHAWTTSDGQQTSGGNQQITFANAGTYTITLTVTDNDGLTATAQDTVTVSELPPVIVEPPPITNTDDTNTLGQAIIVAAGDTQRRNRALNRYTQEFTENMYRLLNKRGFKDDDIHSINMWPQDIDLDGHPDTQRQDYNLFDPEQNFTDAFAQAAARIVSGQQFIFYIHGHARENHFIISADYELSATRLRDLLATLPAGVQQIIILDSCYSGSFLDELAGVADRIVISSADATSLAWNTKYGSFSEKFIYHLRLQDQSILDAFHTAEAVIKAEPKLFREQTPWLDDDGDGKYTSEDGSRLAGKINLGCSIAQGCATAAPPPAIVHVHEQLSFANSQLTLWVKTSPGQDAIRQVRAVFVNPEFVSQNYAGEATDFAREEMDLLYNPAGERYEVFYDGFWTGGLWRIMYQAQNQEGVWSDIATGEVHSNINCNPCVKMTKNQSRYNATSGDEVRIDMLINGQGAVVDLYTAIVFPAGYWITITHPFTLSMPNTIQVYQPNVAINAQRRLSIMDFPLPTDVAKGNYQACGVLVAAENDPHPPENWLHIHCTNFAVD